MKKILIVEDVELNVDLLTQFLEEDYELLVAGDGDQGLVLAERAKPDLILMDISLPGIDGYEAARRLKANQGSRHIPIIGLSAHAMSGDAERARAAGCDDYLTKPIDEQQLFARIRSLLT